MTFNSFIDKYLGTYVDFDGFYGPQCVDLYRQYVKEVLEFPQSPGVTGAYQIFNTASDELYEKRLNTPKAIPEYGDIIIWNKKLDGQYGHVAIFIEGDVNEFMSLDQNFPLGKEVTITHHSYYEVKGWLKPKKESMVNLSDEIIGKSSQRDKVVNYYEFEIGTAKDDELLFKLEEEFELLEDKIASLNEENEQLVSSLEQLEFEKKELMNELESAQTEISRLEQELLEQTPPPQVGEGFTWQEIFKIIINKFKGE